MAAPLGIGQIIAQILAGLLKALFGTDKPMETEVRNEKPDFPVAAGRTDSDLLRELGVEPPEKEA